MAKIKKLSNDIISKIAAGEVVERPASVVKELVENALDAKAKNIVISIHKGGLKEISISDDGIGMQKEDILQSFKRHTTSKLTRLSDLDSISNLGFRGEALASIASISQMKIASRDKKSIEGFYVSLDSGELIDSGSIGMPVGTKIDVSNLFYNVPARKKFLRSESTELKYITDIISKLCLSYLETAFKVFHNGKLLLDIPSDKDYTSRIKTIYTESFFKNLVNLNYSDPHFKLTGFISKPQIARASKASQLLFVNKRFISDGTISSAVREGYQTLIELRKNPPYILFLDIAPELIDVNVHPQKLKVRFLNGTQVTRSVRKAVSLTLQSKDITYIKEGYKGINDYMNTALTELVTSKIPDLNDIFLDNGIIQVHDLYLIKQSEKGLIILDQHAAHERIVYDSLLKLFKRDMHRYYMEQPLSLEFSLSDSVLLEEHLKVFKKIGFELTKITETSFELLAIPALLKDRNIEEIIKEILDDIETYGVSNRIDTKSAQALSYLACRSAIKEGKQLSPAQRAWIFDQLEKSDIKYTCPHGRPAKVEIPLKELNHWFKRT